MNIQRGIYKSFDGEFKTWNDIKFFKEVRKYDVIVIDFGGGIKLMVLSDIVVEKHVTLDGVTVDHIEQPITDLTSDTRLTSVFIGDDMAGVESRITIGLTNPIMEWDTPLTDVASI